MQAVKASDYDLYTGSKRAHHATSDDSDFEETTPTDKGKKRLKFRDATPVDLPQMGNKRDGDTMMMKRGALEYRVGRLKESVTSSQGLQRELSDQKEKTIQLANENKHVVSKVATLERAVTSRQENFI